MARPRSSLAELEGLLRTAEPGGNNIGQYLAMYEEELAVRLGIEPHDLRALVHHPDEELAPQLVDYFERRAEQRAEVHREAVHRLALVAAEQLALTAIWREDAVVLDIRILLGELAKTTEILGPVTVYADAFRRGLTRQPCPRRAREPSDPWRRRCLRPFARPGAGGRRGALPRRRRGGEGGGVEDRAPVLERRRRVLVEVEALLVRDGGPR
jgi:hypothetical protein